jgi:integrase
MAQVIQRIRRSGPRKVKRVAYGFTFQDKDGKQVRVSDASWSREDAEKALATRLLNLDDVKNPPARFIVTFKQMTERYLKEKEVGRKRTLEYDRFILAKLVDHFGADTPLTEITAPRIAEYRLGRLTLASARTGRKLKPASVNRELAVLRGVLRLAADDECGYLEKAPRVRMEKEPQGRLRFLTDDEATRLLDECRKSAEHPVPPRRSLSLYPVVVVALNTGMRRGEILGLTWDRVDFSRGVLQLEVTKSGRRREIPMNQAVYDVLSALPRSGPRLFRGSVRKAFLGAMERAGIQNFRFHDLRHTFASWLTMKGRPLKEVQELLGHASITQTERYAHLAPERLRDAVAALDFNTTSAQRLPRAAQVPVRITG